MEISRYINGTPADIALILENREKRALKQQELTEKFNSPLVSFSLNIAGPVKRFDLADKAYEVGKKELTELFNAKGFAVLFFHENISESGAECIWAVEAKGELLKEKTAFIEETHPLGRLFDIDIIAVNGDKIERTSAGFEERGCIVCGKKGIGCARNRTHDIEEIQLATIKILKSYFDGIFSDILSETAVKALLYEVSISPKPGLVDRISNGAHKDMDFFTFLDSACALGDYFKEISEITFKLSHVKADKILDFLSFSGIKAEKKMYKHTNNVNTHKGAIYSLGILCAAFSYAYANFMNLGTQSILKLCGEIASPSLENGASNPVSTAGERIYKLHGISGARGEAAGGFQAVQNIGLPVYKKYLAEGLSYNDAGVIALLHIMANMNDTNAIKRVGLEKAQKTQNKIKNAINALSPKELIGFAKDIDNDFISDNLSHGGAADMLALTIALLFMEESVELNSF